MVEISSLGASLRRVSAIIGGWRTSWSPEWEAELPGLRGQRVGAAAGAEKLGATLYEVDPGGRVSPLHIHHANEELLIVLSGRADAADRRTASASSRPATSWRSRPGAAATHQVLNRSDEAARVLIASTMVYPEVVEHPDTGKVLAISGRPDEAAAVMLAFRQGDAVPVTEGDGRDAQAASDARPWTRAKA